MDLPETAHRRYDPLRDTWVLVSPGRTDRPWAGTFDAIAVEPRAERDPDCPLCPGSQRASTEVNPHYDSTFVFTNDFAALEPGPDRAESSEGLFRALPVSGTCRVVCFSPRHDLPLGRLGTDGVRRVIDTWAVESDELGKGHKWVQVFENRGAQMGASNPHPHGQIWATTELPVEAERELASQQRHIAEKGTALLLDYAAVERGGSREVTANDDWLVVVPFWATWPFETLVLPTRSTSRLSDLDNGRRNSLAEVISTLLSTYDRLFDTEFPYSMGWHQAPFTSPAPEGWLLHAHYYPPLLRSANVRKFMVGYELLSEPQRDLTPEDAAQRLRTAVRT